MWDEKLSKYRKLILKKYIIQNVNKQLKTEKFLKLQNGVSPNFQFEDNLGPLHLAAKNGNTQCAFYLLQFNANPNMISKVSP